MRFLFWKKRNDEVGEELQAHFRLAVEERIARGEGREQAEAAARREFGNTLLVEEVTRDMHRGAWWERLRQDVHYGTRLLRKSPGFTIVAILTLALGIGANTALFSVVNGVILNPLPFPEPDQLVAFAQSKPNFSRGSVPFVTFKDWRDTNQAFSAMAISRDATFGLTGSGKAEQINGRYVTSDLFSMMGVAALRGRTFRKGEDEVGAPPIAIITDVMWKRRFGMDENILGRNITLDGNTFSIVGVIPAALNDLSWSSQVTEIYLPVGQWKNSILLKRTAGLGFHGIGRMKPGVTIEQARADMTRVTHNLEAAYPDDYKNTGATLIPLKQNMVSGLRPVLLVLLGAVGFVLLIACVNVGNLLLARSTVRERELAIRTALGASRMRVVRQLLTESLLLSALGGALGLALAAWGTRVALASLPVTLPRAAEVGLDARVLVFTTAVSVLAGILFGLVPALKASRPNLQQTLQQGGRGLSGVRHRAQSTLVVVEIAMALVLVAGAGLMIRSLVRLWNVDPGFDPHNVLFFGISLPPNMAKADAPAVRSAYRDLDAKLAGTPGVTAASLTWGAVPLAGDDESVFWVEGQPKPASPNDMYWAVSYVVEPDYLNVMGMRLLRGRFFSAQDNEKSQPVVLIDEVLAAKYFPNQDPVGKHLYRQQVGIQALEIIGVVNHVKQWSLDNDEQQLQAQLYTPFMQLGDENMSQASTGIGVLLRHAGESSQALEAIRRTSEQMSSEQVVYGVQTMDEVVADTLAMRRFSMVLLSVFAALAVGLASIGIYGVISYVVSQRTHEIGVRMALGAQRSDVLRLVLGHGTRMVAAGILIGVPAALALAHFMSTMLFGIRSSDPVTFASVAVLLAAIAIAASYVPAHRAMLVDPMRALHRE
jgi:predicted permease